MSTLCPCIRLTVVAMLLHAVDDLLQVDSQCSKHFFRHLSRMNVVDFTSDATKVRAETRSRTPPTSTLSLENEPRKFQAPHYPRNPRLLTQPSGAQLHGHDSLGVLASRAVDWAIFRKTAIRSESGTSKKGGKSC